MLQMGIVQKVKSLIKRERKQEKVSVTPLAPETKPSITAVDVGREAPKGYEFVDEAGKSQGTFMRTGGYTIVGGRGGSSTSPSSSRITSVSGEVTRDVAYSLEGGKTFTVETKPT